MPDIQKMFYKSLIFQTAPYHLYLLRTSNDYDGNCGKLLVISAIKYLNSKMYHTVLNC